MIIADGLRPPAAFDPSAPAYKDWLHLVVLDHRSGLAGLVNVSLHGAPADPRSRAVGTALVNVPGEGWFGNVETGALSRAVIGLTSIGLEQVAVAVDGPRGTVHASVRQPDEGLGLDLVADALVRPMAREQPQPLGSGWLAWYVVPRLRGRGRVSVAGRSFDLAQASIYYDHNWGRWHWGQDLGWEWGCFLAPTPGPAFFLSRVSDRAHGGGTRFLHVAYPDGRQRTFAGPAVEWTRSGRLETPLRRLPGVLAALHADIAAPHLDRALHVRADDGTDRVEIRFTAGAAAQIIAGDPVEPGYGFIHELVGEFEFAASICGREDAAAGLAVVEHVR